MKLLELNALLEHRNRPVQTNKSILQYFHIWKGLRKRFGDNDELEAFLALKKEMKRGDYRIGTTNR